MTVVDDRTQPRGPVVVRDAAADELELLAAIEQDAAELYRTVGYDFCADGPVRSEEEKLRALHEGTVLVAVQETDLVGFALLLPLDEAAHLLELAVVRAHQGRGVGRALVERAEAWARGAGYSEITLTTFLEVPWNAQLYRRLGYRGFTPGPARPQLLAVRADEAACGFAVQPRVAMRKVLSARATDRRRSRGRLPRSHSRLK